MRGNFRQLTERRNISNGKKTLNTPVTLKLTRASLSTYKPHPEEYISGLSLTIKYFQINSFRIDGNQYE